MIIYQNYTTKSGAERVKAFSDRNVYIERDSVEYTDADDFAYQNRVYTEPLIFQRFNIIVFSLQLLSVANTL